MNWAFFCPTLVGMSRDWAGSSCRTGSMGPLCSDGHHHPASWAFSPSLAFPSFRTWGDQVGQCPVQRLLWPLHFSTVGILGEVRDSTQEHPSARARPQKPETGVPWPVVAQDVCVHGQVWVYVCA